MFPCVFQARIAPMCVGWRKDVVLFNPKLAPACLLKSLIMWMNLTPRSWTFTLTQGVTPVILKDCRLRLITRQPPVIHRVSASQSLGSTVIWARAITTSPTDVTWDRLQSPSLLSNKARFSRRSAAQQFPRSHENGKLSLCLGFLTTAGDRKCNNQWNCCRASLMSIDRDRRLKNFWLHPYSLLSLRSHYLPSYNSLHVFIMECNSNIFLCAGKPPK